MQITHIAGNVGNVKEVKDVGGDKVLNFSVAVDNGKDKNGDKRDASWWDCALWGKRAESLAPYIQKGSKLALSGRPSARAHEGKAYLTLTVNDLTFMSSKSDTGGGGSSDGYQEPKSSGGGGGGGNDGMSGQNASYDLNDDIPFSYIDGHYENLHRLRRE